MCHQEKEAMVTDVNALGVKIIWLASDVYGELRLKTSVTPTEVHSGLRNVVLNRFEAQQRTLLQSHYCCSREKAIYLKQVYCSNYIVFVVQKRNLH